MHVFWLLILGGAGYLVYKNITRNQRKIEDAVDQYEDAIVAAEVQKIQKIVKKTVDKVEKGDYED